MRALAPALASTQNAESSSAGEGPGLQIAVGQASLWGRLCLNPLSAAYSFPVSIPVLPPRRKVVITAVTPEGHGNMQCPKACVKLLANCLAAIKSNAG